MSTSYLLVIAILVFALLLTGLMITMLAFQNLIRDPSIGKGIPVYKSRPQVRRSQSQPSTK